MAGGPLAGASVTFSPKEGQPVATARTNAEGKYSLTTYDAGDGAAAGSYVVLVTKHTAIAEAGPPSHDAFASGNSKTVIGHSAKKKGDEGDAVPPRYASPASSDLSANVKAGETNVIDLTVNP
ncbi:MAG: hypothetical protein R3C49_03135 [Planctomycetaceae bacterium]